LVSWKKNAVLFDTPQPQPGLLTRGSRHAGPTLRYWMQTEVHVYAFSMAANMLLSFFPFLIVIVSLCRYVLGWQAAEDMIFLALRDYFPDPLGEFIRRNLRVTVASRGPFQFVSLALLMFTANGVFEPLEVALNRAWGIPRNRSYFRNQLISLALIFACGAMALMSIMLTSFNQQLWTDLLGSGARLTTHAVLTAFKMAVVPASMLLLFLVYWVLPNGKVPLSRIAPAAVVVGLALELLKYINVLTWPWLRAKLEREYGPFVYSVTIILWGFLASMVVLAGAEWAARSVAGKAVCNPAAESIDSKNTA
jgi:membrane protein